MANWSKKLEFNIYWVYSILHLMYMCKGLLQNLTWLASQPLQLLSKWVTHAISRQQALSTLPLTMELTGVFYGFNQLLVHQPEDPFWNGSSSKETVQTPWMGVSLWAVKIVFEASAQIVNFLELKCSVHTFLTSIPWVKSHHHHGDALSSPKCYTFMT